MQILFTGGKRRNKYGAKKTPFAACFGERTYDSAAEAAYAARLEMLRKAGEVLFWLPQVPIPLPGGAVYRADFMVAEKAGVDGLDESGGLAPLVRLRFVDVKGRDTPVSRLKRRQVREIHGIEVEVAGPSRAAGRAGFGKQERGLHR